MRFSVRHIRTAKSGLCLVLTLIATSGCTQKREPSIRPIDFVSFNQESEDKHAPPEQLNQPTTTPTTTPTGPTNTAPSTSLTSQPNVLELQQWSERIEQQMLNIVARERLRRIEQILSDLNRIERETIDELATQYQERTARSLAIIQRVRDRWHTTRDEALRIQPAE